MKNHIRLVKNFILDLIFPKDCIGCGGEGKYLCCQCLEKIEFVGSDYCPLCKKPSPFNEICPVCKKDTAIKAIWVAGDYNQQILQDLIHNLKYNYLEDISADLAQYLLRYLKYRHVLENFKIFSDNAVFAPVPLHRKRFISRGFNQSKLLANNLGALTGIKTADILQRLKNTETQINLSRQQRQENVKGAFEVTNRNFCNKKIILIDDVLTTGSTFKECAKVLAEAGYDEIYGLVVAQRED